MQQKTIWIVLFCLVSFVWSGITVELEPERITADKPFVVSLVIPLHELPANYQFPTIQNWQGLQFLKTDSIDDIHQAFFSRPYKIRKFRFHAKASKPGDYKIGPVVWNQQGKNHQLGYININVQRSYDSPALSVRVIPSTRKVYMGQQFYLDLQIKAFEHFQGDLNLSSVDLGNDFWSHRSDLSKMEFQRSKAPGVRMEAYNRLAYLAPLKPGALTIPALKFDYKKMGEPKVQEIRKGNMYSRSVTQEPEEAQAFSHPISVEVQALPPNSPANFSGLVGQYSFEVSVDTTQLKVGDAITLRIAVQGNGRPGFIPEPQLPAFSDFRSVPPESKVHTFVKGSQLITKREFTVFLYPKKRGQFEIPPLDFVYFDPKLQSYQTISSRAIAIDVAKGDVTQIPQTTVEGLSVTQQKQIEKLGNDIRFIHTAPYTPLPTPLYKQLWYWIIWIVFICALPLTILVKNMLARRQSNVALQRRSKAKAIKNTHLAKAQQALTQSNSVEFYAYLEKALTDFISNQINVEFRGLLLEQKISALKGLNLSEEICESVKRSYELFEYYQFAPLSQSGGDVQKQWEQQLNDCKALLNNLEKVL
jgi:hypothetical protein